MLGCLRSSGEPDYAIEAFAYPLISGLRSSDYFNYLCLKLVDYGYILEKIILGVTTLLLEFLLFCELIDTLDTFDI